MKKMRNQQPAALQRQQGFTLVEMAVVLVIIGVILSAVMIGRDVQRNSEYVKIRQTFINQWAVAYNTYWQRTGGPVGDNMAAPRLMVNGTNFAVTNGVISGGDMTNVTEPAAICHGAIGPGNGTRAAQSGDLMDLRRLMLDAGVELPQGRGQGFEDRYVYNDSNGNPQEIQVCFQWNKPGTTSGSGNVMVLTGLTPDLARALSVGIKGTADANSGSFRQVGVANGAGGNAVNWTATNQFAQNGSGTQTGREVQVATLAAHFKMNQ